MGQHTHELLGQLKKAVSDNDMPEIKEALKRIGETENISLILRGEQIMLENDLAVAQNANERAEAETALAELAKALEQIEQEVETVVADTPEKVSKITASNAKVMSGYDDSEVLPGINAPLITPSDATEEERAALVQIAFESYKMALFPNDKPNGSSSGDN